MKTQFGASAAALRFAATAAVCGMFVTAGAARADKPILPFPPTVVSTVPSNGDGNPYGVVYVGKVPPGTLQTGDILVANFNNSQNLQGTGTTIVRVDKTGKVSLFYQNAPGVGLTGALGMLSNGMVIVGNLPTLDGTPATAGPGTLIVVDRNGALVKSIAEPKWIQGPWGLAVNDGGNGTAQLFVSNVLNGTVNRFTVSYTPTTFAITSAVTVASGYAHRPDPGAVELGPSGLAYDAVRDILYVANSADNTIYAVANAGATTATIGSGTVVYQDPAHLHGPLDLLIAPNGDFLVANSDGSNADPNQPSEIVEFTPAGKFVAQYSVDPNNGGAFGIALRVLGPFGIQVVAVDDNAATLQFFTVTQ